MAMSNNQGMVNDYHQAKKRSELGYMIGSGLVVSFLLNFILWWPFHWTTWLVQGLIAALSISFFVSAVEYAKMADHIEKAWKQAYQRPG